MLIARLATGAVLLAACIGAMFLLPSALWALLLLALVVVAGYEWGALAGYGAGGRRAFCCLLVISAIAIHLLVASTDGTLVQRAIYGASCCFWLLVVPPWLARGWHVRGLLAAAAGWIVLIPTWLALAQLQAQPVRLLFLMGIVWLADTAAYAAGRAWGRHKLAPRVSPGKTWEGVGGALAAVAVYYVIVSAAAPAQSWARGWAGIMVFASVMAMSIIGDLFESLMKRHAGVKDSGTLLPGHGGVLDRIDGLTAALPLGALILSY